MGEPTVYRQQSTKISAGKPSKDDLRKWKKHRKKKELPDKDPIRKK